MKAVAVITGLGARTSSGATFEATWEAVAHSAQAFPVSVGPCERGFERAKSLAQAAAAEAFASAGLLRDGRLQGVDPARVGCFLSASTPLADGEAWRAPDAVGRFVAARWGVEGPVRNVIAACATGIYAVASAAQWIAQGDCDLVLAGSVEPGPHPLMAAGFSQMGVLTKEALMRPFDAARSGFVFGEGAGLLVVESLAHALRRGRAPRAVVSGWGLGADTHSAYAFNSNGARIAEVIRRALRRAGAAPSSVDHVNAHGTATRLNDALEAQALHQVFGAHAPRLLVSATKSTTGHLLGAAGSVEAALTVRAIERQFAPPTRHLERPDGGLDYVAGAGRSARIRRALSLSYGFGGTIGALLLSEPS
jgi:3-oxoacyl-[acyl-carrier-protein] synthase II